MLMENCSRLPFRVLRLAAAMLRSSSAVSKSSWVLMIARPSRFRDEVVDEEEQSWKKEGVARVEAWMSRLGGPLVFERERKGKKKKICNTDLRPTLHPSLFHIPKRHRNRRHTPELQHDSQQQNKSLPERKHLRLLGERYQDRNNTAQCKSINSIRVFSES